MKTTAAIILAIVLLFGGMIYLIGWSGKDNKRRVIERESERYAALRECLDRTKKPLTSDLEVFDNGAMDWCYDNFVRTVKLESCMGGYCVGLYDKNLNLIGEKTCTNIEGMLEMQIAPGFSMGTGEALEKAIKIANKKLTTPNETE